LNQLLDIHPLQTRVGDFIAGLQEIARQQLTSASVSELMTHAKLPLEALTPYLFWDSTRYTRNLIYRDQFFEVLALCWQPGHKTPIHSHNGQLGWITVVQGELACHDYRFVRSDLMKGKRPASSRPASVVSRPVEVELLRTALYAADGAVSAVDRMQTTHQIENLETSRYGTVSLHVYSKPIDCCAVFDGQTRCCERRHLEYYSVDGAPVAMAA
jgi:cysteine dioxygenase